MTREIIFIHNGTTGVDVGLNMWNAFCLEHRLPHGLIYSEDTKEINEAWRSLWENHYSDMPLAIMQSHQKRMFGKIDWNRVKCDQEFVNFYGEDESKLCVFSVTGPKSEQFRPRAIGIGSELENQNVFAATLEDPKESFSESLRKQTEICDSIQGFWVTTGMDDDFSTDSYKFIMNNLSSNYQKQIKLTSSVYPILDITQSEPWCRRFSTYCNSSLESCDLDVIFEDKFLFGLAEENNLICGSHFRNQLVAVQLASMTRALRFEGEVGCSLNEMHTIQIAFPRLKFLSTGRAPMNLSSDFSASKTQKEIVTESLQPLHSYQMSEENKNMSIWLNFEGGWKSKTVHTVFSWMRRDLYIPMVEWLPTGFKCGISSHPPLNLRLFNKDRYHAQTAMHGFRFEGELLPVTVVEMILSLLDFPIYSTETGNYGIMTLINNTGVRTYWENAISAFENVPEWTIQFKESEDWSIFQDNQENIKNLIQDYLEIVQEVEYSDDDDEEF